MDGGKGKRMTVKILETHEESTDTFSKDTETHECDCISREEILNHIKEHKRLFCRNQIEFQVLSQNDKARVDEMDKWYAHTMLNRNFI